MLLIHQNREFHRQFSESPWNFAFGCRRAKKKHEKCLFTFTQFLCRKQSSEQHTKNVMTSMCNSREREKTRKMYMNNFICFIITKQHMKQGWEDVPRVTWHIQFICERSLSWWLDAHKGANLMGRKTDFPELINAKTFLVKWTRNKSNEMHKRLGWNWSVRNTGTHDGKLIFLYWTTKSFAIDHINIVERIWISSSDISESKFNKSSSFVLLCIN